MQISVQEAAKLLCSRDKIVILAHRKPDGDTLGSCFALLFVLEAMGKTARVECADGYPVRYQFIYGDYAPKAFQPQFIVACDVASRDLLGALKDVYPEVDLCIDHHKSNTFFAARTTLDPAAPAAAQVLYAIIREMGVAIDKTIATALYTGLTTDTGCFRFAHVTSATYRAAADLIDLGAPHGLINKLMFDSKSRGRVEVEKLMMDSLEYHCGNRCAMVVLPEDIFERFDINEDDMDGVSAFPRRIEGILCGVTIRAQKDGSFRVSLRCEPGVDASRICAKFGGGGHSGAAGCTLHGELDNVRAVLIEAVEEELQRV